MKLHTTLILVLSLFATGAAVAQHAGMPGMEGMKDMEGMENSSVSATQKKVTHRAVAVVQAVDEKKGMVMLAHEPVASLDWPAMTMGFQVQDKSLFAKLAVSKKVIVEFVQQGKQYVIIAVR